MSYSVGHVRFDAERERNTVVRGLDPASARLADHMSADPVCCRPDDDIRHVSVLMQERQIRRIPVVDDRGGCCGQRVDLPSVRTTERKKKARPLVAPGSTANMKLA